MDEHDSLRLEVGATAQLTRFFSKADVQQFALLTGDFNPLHLDDEYARQTRFGACIVHGMLHAGLISAVLATVLPGPGTIYLRQELIFLAPIFVNESVTASVEILEVRPDEKRVRLRTCCTKENGELAINGEALVKVSKMDQAWRG